MSNNRLNLLVNFDEAGLDKLSGGLRNLVGLGKKGSRAMRDMARHSRSLDRELASVRRELKGASGNVTELVDRERDLERQVARANRELSQHRSLSQIDSKADAMRQRGADLRSRGRDHIVQGASLLAPAVLAVREAAQFQSRMVDIQQKMELTDAAAASLETRILAMSTAAGRVPEEMRSGVDMLAGLGGLSLSQIEEAMGPAGRLATAYRVELPDAARAAHSSIMNLKVPAARTGQIFDMMAAAGNEGAFEIRDMARHFPSLTAQMAALGDKGAPAVADLSAALQVAMRTAGNADEAGNNISNLLSAMNAPATIAAFEKNFGVDLPSAMKKLTDEGYSSLEAITLITQKATNGDTQKLGFAFGDKQARMGILAMIQNLDEYRRVRGAAESGGGTVDAAFTQREANDPMVQWERNRATFGNLAITLGRQLLPVVNETLGSIASITTRIAEWAERNPEAANSLMKIVVGLGVTKIGIGALQIAFGGLLGPMSTAYRYFKKVDGISRFGQHLGKLKNIAKGAGPVLVRAFGVMRTAALFLARGVVKAGLMIMANPLVLAITAIVLAIGGAAYLIYMNWDRIKAAFWQGVAAIGGAVQNVKGVLVQGFSFIASLGSRAVEIGRNIIIGLANGIRAAPGAVWNALKSIVIGGVDRIKSFLGINSPSRLFMGFGGNMVEGMTLGLNRNRQQAFASARRLATGVAGAAALGTGAPLAAATPVQNAPGSSARYEITINPPPGQSAEEIAVAVGREIDRRERAAAARRRSSFADGTY